jgi:hypothetical protein
MSSAESALMAQIRAGQEQTNARLEAVLVAIHRLCDLVARLAPVQEDAGAASCLHGDAEMGPRQEAHSSNGSGSGSAGTASTAP